MFGHWRLVRSPAGTRHDTIDFGRRSCKSLCVCVSMAVARRCGDCGCLWHRTWSANIDDCPWVRSCVYSGSVSASVCASVFEGFTRKSAASWLKELRRRRRAFCKAAPNMPPKGDEITERRKSARRKEAHDVQWAAKKYTPALDSPHNGFMGYAYFFCATTGIRFMGYACAGSGRRGVSRLELGPGFA